MTVVASIAAAAALYALLPGPGRIGIVAVLVTGSVLATWVVARNDLRGERLRARRAQSLLDHTSDALLVVGTDGTVTFATPSAQRLFGAELTGWHGDDLEALIHPDERAATTTALAERLASAGGRPVRLRVRLRDRGSQEAFVEAVVVDRRDDPAVAGLIVAVHDSTERVSLERRVRELAFNDPVTGLCNRQLFHDRLGQALARAGRTRGRLAVLMCDLDDFKDVNDTLGHAVGDRVLAILAARLEQAARASDTVARVGGDEFAVLLEGFGHAREAVDIARRVMAVTSMPVEVGEHLLGMKMTIGITVDDGERSAEDILRDADVALHEAKTNGKQRWSLHRPPMTHRAQARLQLAGDLSRAVADGDILAVYQPIISLDDESIVEVEGLARWHHPVRGHISPAEFIPLAERTGQIAGLGDQVMRHVASTLRSWLDVRPELALRVAVNVSAQQLRQPGFAAKVEHLLAEHCIDPDRLVLELTESLMLADTDDAIKVMSLLRELGVRFAVDDFGTGYSSLSYLRRLPVDVVKVDRSFVRDLGTDPVAAEMVRAIVHLADSLGLGIIAEGVETEAQRDTLVGVGCRFAQGYLFGRPAPAAELTPHLLEHAARQRNPRPAGSPS